MPAMKRFEDSSYLKFDWGDFDRWCVYYVSPQGDSEAPKDADYFQALKNYAKRYGAEKIYEDFVTIYDAAGRECVPEIMDDISRIAASYQPEDRLRINKIYSVLYMAMVAEQNKKGTKLGKRIKRLGIHILLFENASPVTAANCMRGVSWKTIDTWCSERKF